MIDTCVYIIPVVSTEVLEAVKGLSLLKQALDCPTGELVYEIVTCDLRNSADSRIAITILDRMWTREIESDSLPGKPAASVPYKVKTTAFLKVETSIHKQMLGHNCFGGSSDYKALTRWLQVKLEKELHVLLPDCNYWLAKHIDVTETYNLGSAEAVKDWFSLMKDAKYQRREGKEHTFGETGLYIPGDSTTVKFYHKGTEFWVHDRKRCKKFISPENLQKIQDLANNLLRVEVSIKARKLKYDFGRLPMVCEITDEYLTETHDAEIEKILKGYGDGMKAARQSDAVEKILYENFKDELAGRLLGTWYRLASKGEKAVRQSMSKATFQRHKKLLLDSGITWIATDVIIADTLVPLDFKPMRGDRHHMNFVLPEIQKMLDEVAA